MAKFGRNYRLTIETGEGEAIVISNPTTIQFSITRNTMASLNSTQMSIFNLSPAVRDRIFQDRFNPTEYKRVVLQAGYENLSTVFIGNIFQANSKRVGADIVTFIDARDGGFDTTGTLTNETIEGGSVEDVIRALAGGFEKVTIGDIGSIDGSFRRPIVLNGNTYGLIDRYSNGTAFIDLEELKVLKNDEVVEGEILLINSDTGLLGTPIRNDAYLTVETIFEPRVIMGQQIEIQSDVAPIFDGQYKVIGVTHNCVISDAISGEAKSTFNLLVGSQLFGGFNRV